MPYTMSSPSYDAPDYLDNAGATASLLCAVHCALMPMIVTLLPLMGLGFLANEATEWGLVALSATLGISSLCLGYRRHRSRRAPAVLALGMGLLATGRVAEHRDLGRFGVALVVGGGLTIAAAHLYNRHLCRTCRLCQIREEEALDRLLTIAGEEYRRNSPPGSTSAV